MRIAAFYENLLTAAQEEGKDLPEVLKAAREAGLEAIYISGDSLLENPEGLLRLFQELELPVEGLHQHFDFGLQPEDERYRPLMDWAVQAGARNFLVVPGRITPAQKPRQAELLQRMLEGTRRAVAYGQALGLKVCIEDYDHLDSPLNCLAGVETFLREIPDLCYAYDTGNFVCYDEDPLIALERFADRICLVHLKDRTPRSRVEQIGVHCADGTWMHTAPVGAGVMPMQAALERLKEKGYSGNAVVELFDCPQVLRSLQASIRYLREWREKGQKS